MFNEIRDYLVLRLQELDYKEEHQDIYDLSSIPNIDGDDSFAIIQNDIDAVSYGNSFTQLEMPISVICWRKNTDGSIQTRAESWDFITLFLKSVLSLELSTCIVDVSGVKLNRVALKPLSDSNDSDIEIQIDLIFTLNLSLL